MINAASASGSWTNVDVTTFVDAKITTVTAENLNDILLAIGETYHEIRGPFDTPFSLTSRDDLQKVVNLVVGPEY